MRPDCCAPDRSSYTCFRISITPLTRTTQNAQEREEERAAEEAEAKGGDEPVDAVLRRPAKDEDPDGDRDAADEREGELCPVDVRHTPWGSSVLDALNSGSGTPPLRRVCIA